MYQVALCIGLAASSTHAGRSRFYQVFKPATGNDAKKIHRDDIQSRYKQVKNPDDVKDDWIRQHAMYENKCSHYTCNDANCQYGRRKKIQFVLTVRFFPKGCLPLLYGG